MNVDFEGNELKIGDSVIAYKIGERRLVRGKVVSLGKIQTTIEHGHGKTSFPDRQIAKVKND